MSRHSGSLLATDLGRDGRIGRALECAAPIGDGYRPYIPRDTLVVAIGKWAEQTLRSLVARGLLELPTNQPGCYRITDDGVALLWELSS